MASTGASAVIKDGKIEISIDIDALPLIVSGSCCCDGLDGLWKVTDAAVSPRKSATPSTRSVKTVRHLST